MTKDKDLVEFEELDLEGEGNNTPTMSEKLSAHLKFLKENLEPEKYAEAVKALGLKTDLSNEDLLEQFKTLLAQLVKGQKKEGDEEEEEEEEDMMDYKDYMAKCMKEGKSVKECADEWKEKYPEAEEPSKEEIAEVAALAKKKKDDEDEEYPAPDKKMMDLITNLQKQVTELQGKLTQKEQTAEIAAKVDTLIEGGHIAPSQKESLIKMASQMDPKAQQDMLEFFRTTQKISAFNDVGVLESNQPGTLDKAYSEEERALIKEAHGINAIIEERGVKPRRNN